MARTGAAAPTRPEDNDLLAALPAAELAALRVELEPVELALGRALYESGGKQDYVYFPTDAVISPSRAVVQIGGRAYRMRARSLKRAFERRAVLMELLLRYTQALITQMTQTAVCNRHHELDQQLCRWLLLSIDRLPGMEVRMTQELIAAMLGVRREGVTSAAGKLQAAGLIRYRRGRIQVLDRPGLERRVCECYGVVKREYQRLLGDALRRARTAPSRP
jgi:CRP-like cAMP-binding protein